MWSLARMIETMQAMDTSPGWMTPMTTFGTVTGAGEPARLAARRSALFTGLDVTRRRPRLPARLRCRDLRLELATPGVRRRQRPLRHVAATAADGWVPAALERRRQPVVSGCAEPAGRTGIGHGSSLVWGASTPRPPQEAHVGLRISQVPGSRFESLCVVLEVAEAEVALLTEQPADALAACPLGTRRAT